MRALSVAGFALLALTLVACGGPIDDSTSSPSGTSDVAQEVGIKGFAFTSQEVTVQVGGKVTWTNRDSVHHTVTGDTWDSGDLGQEETYSRTFEKSRTYDYTCTYHPSMKGTVIVK